MGAHIAYFESNDARNTPSNTWYADEAHMALVDQVIPGLYWKFQDAQPAAVVDYVQN